MNIIYARSQNKFEVIQKDFAIICLITCYGGNVEDKVGFQGPNGIAT